mmetsp:Transcript_7085/g.20718  ORF Transcript_7085/g.20718 Transcript_7085/m.20718 type:complete len:419 (-) Transcript_7085:227-1483(-)
MSADGQPSSEAALLITVSDPEKHGTSITAAFVDYKLSTVTQLSRYAAKEFFVRRRYRDFVWLRDRLCHAFPGCVVPPLPTVDSPLKDDRFSPNFIERRQAGLQLFLRRVAGHERLRESSDLQTFLEAKVWELQTVKNATGSSWLGALFDGTQESLKSVQSLMAHKVPDEEAIERVRAFAANYATIASASASKQHAAVRTQADMASDLRQLAPALDMLSQSETELSLPLTHMAAALDRVKELHLARVQAEHVCGLSALLAFNTGMATALNEVLANRDAALLQYQKAAAALDASTKERQRWQEAEHSGAPSPRSGVLGKLDELMYDPQKGSKVEVRVKEADAELSAAKERWEAISTSIHTEVDRFHRQTNADFSRGLREHVLEQLEFEQAQQREWEQLLDIVERVETVPGTAASFRPSSS